MKHLLILFTLLVLTFPSIAQEEKPQSGITDAEISDLLKTLEDPAKRDEFIKNLKTLNQAQEEQKKEEALPVISQKLNIDAGTSKLIATYENFLKETGLKSSTFGKLVLTALVFVGAMVLFFVVRRISFFVRGHAMAIKQKLGLQHSRLRLYSRLFRYFGYFITILLLVYTLNLVWNVMDMGFLRGDEFGLFVGQIASIAFVILLAILVWEAINGVLDNVVHRAGYKESLRLQTVMPMVRNVMLIAFLIMFVLILLSELGINVVPLLAGAGVLGIAIGFGAQTMVKDFITGFTVILEDLMQVGDYVTLAGKSGTIEKLTIRKVQVRDIDGTVYTIPFSEISIVQNWTKDYNFVLMNVGVAYREDIDTVFKLLEEVDEELRADEEFKDYILEPIEIMGVDAFADSAVLIRIKIKTKPLWRWAVKRAFNRRMKYKFDEHNIEIPFPHQTIYFGADQEGKAPPARVVLEGNESEDKK